MYPDKIMLKKLDKIVEEFLRNHYLKSFGFQKKKYDANFTDDKSSIQYDTEGRIKDTTKNDDEEEYYYDEEDDENAQV